MKKLISSAKGILTLFIASVIFVACSQAAKESSDEQETTTATETVDSLASGNGVDSTTVDSSAIVKPEDRVK